MIDINRNNYETFFLLYTDNELSVAEKKVVEKFLLLNPDLQEELAILQQSILQPDDIVFGDKMNLFKNDYFPSGIQEKLLLHLDNELPATERTQIDTLINTDADFRKEWNILQQTKLPGNHVAFQDKESLYRNEVGRLVVFPWRRMAVAAILIGVGTWGGWSYLNNESKHGEVEIAAISKTPKIPDAVNQFKKQTTTPILSNTINEKDLATTAVIVKRFSKDIPVKSRVKVGQAKFPAIEIQTVTRKEKDNNLPKPYSDNLNSTGSNNIVAAVVTPEKQSSTIVNSLNRVAEKNTEKIAPASVYAATAVSYADETEENNNRVLFMDEEKIKKTKLGGIFRKVKRVIERNANIKPGGNNIKVANLEFAIQ